MSQTAAFTKDPARGIKPGFTPDITVITVVFNAIRNGRRERFLQCLGSVQGQNGVRIEHLIIDGGSQDGTVELVRDFVNPDVRIRLFSEPDGGIYDGMNRGIAKASGKYIIFLNSDDFYHDPLGLAASFAELERTQCDFSFAPARMVDEQTGLGIEHPNTHPIPARIFSGMEFSHQTLVVSRAAMGAIGGFDLRYRSSADYDSVLRLVFAGYRACRVNRCFATFRLGGFSCVNIERSQRECGQIFADLYNRHIGTALSPEQGLRLYVQKDCFSREMRLRLRPFYEKSFGHLEPVGNAVAAFADVVTLKRALSPLRRRGLLRPFRLLVGLPFVLLSHPVLLTRYCRHYLRVRKTASSRRMALKEAFRLLSGDRLRARLVTSPARSNGCLAAVSPLDFLDVSGTYGVEYWGAWAGRCLQVRVRLPSRTNRRRLRVRLLVGGYICAGLHGCRNLHVVVNGELITEFRIHSVIPQPCDFILPDRFAAKSELEFTLTTRRDYIPREFGVLEDDRRLGIAFSGLIVESAGRNA